MLPISPQLALAMARQHLAAGRLNEAEALCRAMLADSASQSAAHSLLKEIAASRGAPAERELHRGDALLAASRVEEAINAYQSAIALDPLLAEAHANLGSALKAGGHYAGAVGAFLRAILLQPTRSLFHGNLGLVLAAAGRLEEAKAAYQRAVALDAGNAESWYHLGNLLADKRDRAGSIDAYRSAIAARPGFARAYSNLGMALHNAGDIDGSIAAYSACVDLEPTWAEPRWNRALSHLLLGDFPAGWAEFDQRNRMTPPASREFPRPLWTGEDLSGKTILLHSEMGLGDSIQFCRFAPLVAQRGARVLLQVEATLVDLMRSLQGVERVCAIGEELEPFDVHASLMSLPAIFRSDARTIPRETPYLRPDSARERVWEERLASGSRRLRVGIVSGGRPQHQYDRERSIDLARLRPWWDVKGIDVFNLHKRAAGSPVGMSAIATTPMKDFTDELHSFADTAALVSRLDLVIAVDTSTAHLAGALGKPTWLLLARVPDWRWLLERDDSPWYPTARLFRQERLDDWSGVIERVREALIERAARHATPSDEGE